MKLRTYAELVAELDMTQLDMAEAEQCGDPQRAAQLRKRISEIHGLLQEMAEARRRDEQTTEVSALKDWRRPHTVRIK